MCFSKYFVDTRILHQTSCVAEPQQNGRVKHKHRHILNDAHSLLFKANLPIKFWGESVLAADHVLNRTPSRVLTGKTPYECLYGTTPSYANIKVFGCLCFANKASRDMEKFGKRNCKCIFIGYPFGKRAGSYTIWNEMSSSRDVVFDETMYLRI